MKTYIVVTLNGNDEWIEYEGSNIKVAQKIARIELERNERAKQRYTVEIREMTDDYYPGSDNYNYNLIDY